MCLLEIVSPCELEHSKHLALNITTASTTVQTSANMVTGDDIILRTTGDKVLLEASSSKESQYELRRGEVFGFLGPNSALKKYHVGMILGLVDFHGFVTLNYLV